MSDVQTAVQSGVDAYAAAERALQAAHDALLQLPATYQSLNSAGTIGYLETQERCSQAQALAGDVAGVLNSVFVNHQSDTKRAQELGIDLPAPPAVAAAHPNGGGR